MVKRDTSFNLGAPLSIAGPDVDMRINGTAFDIVGDEDHPGVSVFYDDESGGDGATASQAVYDSMNNPNQGKQIVGAEGDYGPHPEPSIRDDTDLIRNSGDPDARNVLNPNFLYNFTQSIASLADYRYSGNTHLSGRTELGTEGSPAITFVDGDLKLSGSGSGYGILVVTGTMDYSGAFDFDGLVLIIGEGSVDIRGANKDITGGMLIANLEESGGEHVFGVPDIWLRGNSGFFFDSTSIRMALGLLPLKTLMWREITPDIEPAMAGS